MKFSIGLGIIIKRDDKVLIGKRIGSHGAHTWSFPGGNLEEGEKPEKAAAREVLEETGLIINHLSPIGFTFDNFEEIGKSYITLFYISTSLSGIPEIKEPDKCLLWKWASLNDLPKPLFLPIESLLKNFKKAIQLM